MSDIPVEKGKWSVWANNEIESLRHGLAQAQERVKELSEVLLKTELKNGELAVELAALKAGQGEPVAWYWMDDGRRYVTTAPPSTWDAPLDMLEYGALYTSAPAGQRPADLTIPEGWQLVPVESTPEMRNAGWNNEFIGHKLWKDILSAAPKPEDQE